MNKIFLGEFDKITINNEVYTLTFMDGTTKNLKKSLPNTNKIECVVNDVNNDMLVFARFDFMHDIKNRDFTAWTANIINDKKMQLALSIENLLNDNVLKLKTL